MKQDEISRALGRIEGKLEGIDNSISAMDSKIDHLDGRLRAVEIKSGVISLTVSGAISALAATLGYGVDVA